MEGLKKTNIAKFQFDHSKVEEQLKSIRNNVAWSLNIVISIPCDIIFRWFHDWHATEDETGRGETGQVRSLEGTFPFSLRPSNFVLLYRIMFIISRMEAAWPSAFDALFSAWSSVKLAFLSSHLGSRVCTMVRMLASHQCVPSSIRSDEGLTLETSALYSLRWPIYIFNLVDITKLSHQCGPGSIPTQYHAWVESRLAPRVFLPPQNQHFQIPVQPRLRTCVKTSLGWSGFLSKYYNLFIFYCLFSFQAKFFEPAWGKG